MSLISSSDLMNSLGESLDAIKASIKWVKCPACGDDVTKFCPNQVWGDTKGNTTPPHIESLCVECSETLKSFKAIVYNWPQEVFDNYPEPRIEMKWVQNQPAFLLHKGEKVYQWKNQIARLWLRDKSTAEPEYLIRHENNRFTIYVAGQDDPIYSLNAIDAWFKVIGSLRIE